jgi:squalene-hopene/tetraprenyl-beta-curcumene cyclase
MRFSSPCWRWNTWFSLVFLLALPAFAAGELPDWKPAAAARYLDERANAWFTFTGADRGEGLTRSSCLSCHTMLPYVLARPVLRKLTGAAAPTEQENRVLTQLGRRSENWKNLDTKPYRLFYDFNERKKKESWGTESVLNAVAFAFADRYQELQSPREKTRQAFARLWSTQSLGGDQKGAWPWLNFGLEPWESDNGGYYGAALAAVAVGTAPGYYRPGSDKDLDNRVRLLSSYLKDKLPAQSLYNQTFALWAAAKLDFILTADARRKIVADLFSKQQADGGWRLASLGAFTRKDGTAEPLQSDGYATGLVLHVLQNAGVPKSDARIAKGLAWLKTHQTASGAWQGFSLNKERDPATHVGKFMSDAATGYAVLALDH